MNRPIDRSEVKEASALGAAMAAAKGVGWFPTIEAAAASMEARVIKTFLPDTSRVAAYHALAEVYEELWPLLSKWNKKRGEISAKTDLRPADH